MAGSPRPTSVDSPLPHNLDAERAVLGAALLDNAALSAFEIARPTDFFLIQHQKIVQALLLMREQRKTSDLITLSDELERQGELEAAGGAAYVASLVDGVPRVTNVEHYARIVAEKARLRVLIHVVDAIERQAFEAHADVDSLAERGLVALSHLRQLRAGAAGCFRFASSEEFLKRDCAEARAWLAERLLPARSQTIWQGRPKVGKSHTLLQLAFDLACGLPVFTHFPVRRAVRVAYCEFEEAESLTKARFAAMLRAHGGQGPEAANLHLFTRTDLERLKLLPRELLGARLKDFCRAICNAGAELVILVSLRRLLVGDANEPEVAERFNDALDALETETGAATALAHHDRKAPAETAEARGLGSTMFAARADAIFDLNRAPDGLRRVAVEARYDACECFYLRRESVGDGELIRLGEPPADPRDAKRQVVQERVAAGESIHRAAQAEGVPYSTAKRWMAGF